MGRECLEFSEGVDGSVEASFRIAWLGWAGQNTDGDIFNAKAAFP